MCQLLLSDVGYVPTPNVHSDVWDCVEFYAICMLLACRLKITFTFSLKLIISFLVQLQHLPLPSLIVTSSQVRVGTPLPLLSCCISGLGPEGLQHNHTIPVVSPGTTWGDPCIFLGETLPTRTFHAKLNGRSAVSTRCPTTLQHPLEKQVTSLQNCFWFTSNTFLQRLVLLLLAPTSLSYKEATCKSCTIKGLLYAHENPNSCSKIWRPLGLTLRCMPYGRGTLRIPLQRIL